MGGSADPAAFAGGGVGIAGPQVGREFLRAVARRRWTLIGRSAVGVAGLVGLLVLIVILAMRTPQPAAAGPRVRVEEPTFWNLRPGVENPGDLDSMPGTLGVGERLSDSGAGPVGTADGAGMGVSPRRWPEDLAPR